MTTIKASYKILKAAEGSPPDERSSTAELASEQMREEGEMKASSVPSELTLSVHKYRVMQGETIIGQFSNAALAREAALDRRGSVVLDASVEPPLMVYQGGTWIGEMGRSTKSVVRRNRLAQSPRGSKAAGAR